LRKFLNFIPAKAGVFCGSGALVGPIQEADVQVLRKTKGRSPLSNGCPCLFLTDAVEKGLVISGEQ
jgi:hypothetical protein